MTFADRVYAALGPAMQDLGGPLLRPLVDALCSALTPTDYLVQQVAGQPGTPLSNLALSPYPRWLAQLAGVAVPVGYTDAQARVLVGGASSAVRGTPGAMTAAVAATLTGTQTVVLYERDGGDPYAFRFVTYAAETPNPAATAAAALTQKSVGLVMTAVVSPGATWDQFERDYPMTWDQAEAAGYSWDQLGALIPKS